MAYTNLYDAVDAFKASQGITPGHGGPPIAVIARGLLKKDGSKALAGDEIRFGSATLASGTVTVADTSITAKSVVIPVGRGVTNAGALGVTYTAGTGFVIASSGGSDARVVDYIIIEKP